MKEKMKKEIYVPIVIILIAELLMFSDTIFYGLGVHIINFLIIIFIIIYSSLRLEEKNILCCLILIILLRVISFSVPQFFTIALLQYPLIYGIMFIPIYYVIKNQQITSKDLGIDFNKLNIYLPISVLIGIIMSIIEYKILDPLPLIENIKISNVILIIVVMFVFVGTVEEIVFRSILQTRIEKVFGLKYGILLSSSIFGAMHANYGMISEIIFAFMFGIILGYIFQKTRSVPFVASIHGIANVMAFGILPSILII